MTFQIFPNFPVFFKEREKYLTPFLWNFPPLFSTFGQKKFSTFFFPRFSKNFPPFEKVSLVTQVAGMFLEGAARSEDTPRPQHSVTVRDYKRKARKRFAIF